MALTRQLENECMFFLFVSPSRGRVVVSRARRYHGMVIVWVET